jgi:protein-S-isoprenylcysteine O-methyltransferase Ste14
MDHDFFRWPLLLLLLLGFGMSARFRRRARIEGGTIERRQEPASLIAMRLLVGLPFFVGLLAWLIRPSWMAWSALALPTWARGLGLVIGFGCLPIMAWVFASIGSNISETVLLKDGHQLVTHGPYHWVRHPLYSTGGLLFLSIGLVTANAFLAGFALLILVGVRLLIVPREEASLIERFGDDYRAYRRRTGALLPPWPRIGG